MDQSLKQAIDPIVKVTKEYHLTIVITALSFAIAFAVFLLYQVVVTSTTTGVDGYIPEAKVSNTFDKATIDKINSLRAASEADQPLNFPDRANPFVE